jgi:phosphoglycolate phosphatase-like HAD superfamily hydrolase
VRLVLFDLDGVLIDSEAGITGSMMHAASKVRGPMGCAASVYSGALARLRNCARPAPTLSWSIRVRFSNVFEDIPGLEAMNRNAFAHFRHLPVNRL